MISSRLELTCPVTALFARRYLRANNNGYRQAAFGVHCFNAGEGSVNVRARKCRYSSHVTSPGFERMVATGVGRAIPPASLTKRHSFSTLEYCRQGLWSSGAANDSSVAAAASSRNTHLKSCVITNTEI